jgi:hypothetical protein
LSVHHPNRGRAASGSHHPIQSSADAICGELAKQAGTASRTL